MPQHLPTGIVTFLFTDIEGSTKLLEGVGADRYAELLGIHHNLIRGTVASHGGIVVMSEGDAFFVVFTDHASAVQSAMAAQSALSTDVELAAHELSVRMGLHTGSATLGGDNYVGIDVHIASRISAAAHGGQILVSESVVSGTETAARGLGSYWLKDIAEPLHLFQLTGHGLADDFPPIAASPTTPHNAPVQLSTFVGRDADVQRGLSLLETARLVTLTGTGGTGKTRLSIAIGSALTNQFNDGVFFVPLAGITDVPGVASAMLEAVEAPPSAGTTAPADHIATYLADRNTLLIIDNFEQVRDAAPIVAGVLAASRDTRILVTSRIPLALEGEQEMHVPPLVLEPAIELFVDRARSVQPGYEPNEAATEAITDIVQRLDALPLAIELAAARVRMMTPKQIADTLEPLTLEQRSGTAAAHQRTLRDTIQWSYDLLTPAEQMLAARLSVFIGGAGIDEIIAVCDPSELAIDPIGGLETLVAQSLLVVDPETEIFRVRMLETIREFGLSVLADTDELDGILDRHVEAYLALAETAAQFLEATNSAEWTDRLAADHANIEAAINRVIATGQGDEAQRFVTALWRYWQTRGHLDTGHRHAEQALALAGTSNHVRANALDAAGSIAYWCGDMPATTAFYEDALDAHRAGGNTTATARALWNLSFPVMDRGDTDQSRALLEEARLLLEGIDDVELLSGVYTSIARSWLDDDPEKAREAAAMSMTYAEQMGETMPLGWATSLHASALYHLGDYRGAVEGQQRTLSIFTGYRDVTSISVALAAITEMARKVGDLDVALFLAGGVSKQWESSGLGLVTFHDMSLADYITPENRASLPDTLQARFEEGRNAPFDEIVDTAMAYRVE
jgi:predicted ATPase/class 3 adenylate cyclase